MEYHVIEKIDWKHNNGDIKFRVISNDELNKIYREYDGELPGKQEIKETLLCKEDAIAYSNFLMKRFFENLVVVKDDDHGLNIEEPKYAEKLVEEDPNFFTIVFKGTLNECEQYIKDLDTDCGDRLRKKKRKKMPVF